VLYDIITLTKHKTLLERRIGGNMGINNKERMRQVINYDGLRYDTITPTDIDGLVEYKGKAYAIIEMKHRNKDVSKGQLIALERMAEDLSAQGKLVTIFVCEHYVDNPERDVIAAKSIVRMCWFNGVWRIDMRKTLKERLDGFIAFAKNL
jgi:hypothetical protein